MGWRTLWPLQVADRWLDRHRPLEVLRLANPLRKCQRAQFMDSARPLDRWLGARCDREVRKGVLAGELSSAHLHDARPRHCGREPLDGLPRSQGCRAHSEMERQAFKERHGFRSATGPHEHWHVDVSYIKVAGTFYYLCTLLDGCSRFIVHSELRESMSGAGTRPFRRTAL